MQDLTRGLHLLMAYIPSLAIVPPSPWCHPYTGALPCTAAPLCRSGDVEAAVAFAQGTLATLLARATSRSSSAGGDSPSPSFPPTPAAAAPPLALTASTAALGATSTAAGAEGAGGAAGSGSRSGLGSGDALNEAALRDVVALVAYARPEASPLAWLLGQEQRERVADAVNAALLWQAYGGQGEGLRKVRGVGRGRARAGNG